MATPDGSVVDEVNSVEDGPPPPKGSRRDDRGEWETSQPLVDITVVELGWGLGNRIWFMHM